MLLLSTPAVAAVGASKWGTRGHARVAGLLQREGVVVGRWDDGRGRPELLAYDGPEHQLVAGASRSGKGTGHVVPTLLNWRGSALVYDLKGELWSVTAGFRDRFGHSVRFAPTRPGTCRFNPLLEIRREHMVRDAQNLAAILVDPSGAKPSLDVWDQSASQFLTALILHVLLSEPDGKKHLGRVRELLLDFEETISVMQRTLHEVDVETGEAMVHPEIARCARSLAEHGERFCSSVRGTMEGYLILWADPEVVAATSASDFCASDLMVGEHPLTLYIEPPPSDADRLRPLIRAMLYQISRCLMQELETDNRGRAKRHKLLLQLDEFPTLGKLPFIADNLRQMAGYGLKAHLIVQSFSDIAEAYGRDNTILDNCHVVVAFASADIQSARAGLKDDRHGAGAPQQLQPAADGPAGPPLPHGVPQRAAAAAAQPRGGARAAQRPAAGLRQRLAADADPQGAVLRGPRLHRAAAPAAAGGRATATGLVGGGRVAGRVGARRAAPRRRRERRGGRAALGAGGSAPDSGSTAGDRTRPQTGSPCAAAAVLPDRSGMRRDDRRHRQGF